MENRSIDDIRTILRLKLEKFISWDLRMDYLSQIKGEVIIYGAGAIGKELYKCFDNKPRAFWDANPNLSFVYGLPVYRIEEGAKFLADIENDITVIVTPVWAFDEIRNNINALIGNVNVISLEGLVEKL